MNNHSEMFVLGDVHKFCIVFRRTTFEFSKYYWELAQIRLEKIVQNQI